MLMGMLGSKHPFMGAGSDAGFYIVIAIIVALEANAIVGKMGPMASVKGVIHSSVALTAVLGALLVLV